MSRLQGKSSLAQSGTVHSSTVYRTTTSNVLSTGLTSSVRKSMLAQETERSQRFLGQDLDVVVFLMGVEIERLYAEKDLWRQKCETLENQNLDKMHYEQLMRELREQIVILEQEREGFRLESQRYRMEIEEWQNRLALLVKEKDSEIDVWKSRIVELEKSWSSRLDEEKTRYSNLEKELLKFSGLQAKYNDAESKLVLLTTEIERWQGLFNTKSSEYDELVAKLNELQLVIQRQSAWEIEIKNLNVLIESKNNELQEERNRVARLEEELVRLSGFKSKYEETENKLVLLTSEIERWRGMYTSKQSDFEDLQRQLAELQLVIQTQAGWEVEIQKLRQVIEIKDSELNDWRTNFRNLETRIAEYEIEIQKYRAQL